MSERGDYRAERDVRSSLELWPRPFRWCSRPGCRRCSCGRVDPQGTDARRHASAVAPAPCALPHRSYARGLAGTSRAGFINRADGCNCRLDGAIGGSVLHPRAGAHDHGD